VAGLELILGLSQFAFGEAVCLHVFKDLIDGLLDSINIGRVKHGLRENHALVLGCVKAETD